MKTKKPIYRCSMKDKTFYRFFLDLGFLYLAQAGLTSFENECLWNFIADKGSRKGFTFKQQSASLTIVKHKLLKVAQHAEVK